MDTQIKTNRMLIFGLGKDRVGWDSNTNNWDTDYKWCLYIGFILLFYCTIALCCIMAGRCSKGGRDREILCNEEVQTTDQRKYRTQRPQSHYDVQESYYEEPVVSVHIFLSVI